MSKLQRKLFEALSDFNINEDEKDSKSKKPKPTDTAEKPDNKPADDAKVVSSNKDDLKRIKRLAGLTEAEVLDRPPVKQPQEIELDKPGGFNVVLLNDPVTPAEVVVEALMAVIGLNQQAAMRRMMRAHRGGWHVVATYASSDVAETVAERLMAHCRGNTNYDHYRTMRGIPQYPRGPGGFRGPWPTQFDVMEAGG